MNWLRQQNDNSRSICCRWVLIRTKALWVLSGSWLLGIFPFANSRSVSWLISFVFYLLFEDQTLTEIFTIWVTFGFCIFMICISQKVCTLYYFVLAYNVIYHLSSYIQTVSWCQKEYMYMVLYNMMDSWSTSRVFSPVTKITNVTWNNTFICNQSTLWIHNVKRTLPKPW